MSGGRLKSYFALSTSLWRFKLQGDSHNSTSADSISFCLKLDSCCSSRLWRSATYIQKTGFISYPSISIAHFSSSDRFIAVAGWVTSKTSSRILIALSTGDVARLLSRHCCSFWCDSIIHIKLFVRRAASLLLSLSRNRNTPVRKKHPFYS